GPALVAGVVATRFGLPPMVGYLVCGFALNFTGVYSHDRLTMIGNLGVTLLLFTIGLKLDLRSLLRPVIWAGTTLHTAIIIAILGPLLYWLSLAGLQVLAGVTFPKALLIAFALSFSSTVFAVKILEDKGESHSKHGQTVVGILIMQDIIAVIFLAASTGKLPSLWALGLLGLIPMRYVLMLLLHRAGHSGELQTLYGIALAFGGYDLFDAVGMKGDLGALVIGSMLASHPLAEAVSKRLLGFKDLLLVGFFLSIGMSGTLTASTLWLALLLTVLALLKVVVFFGLFVRFRMRARSATLSALMLGNYSEFGLIVGAIAVSNAWLTQDWLVTIALALTMTIILAAPVNLRAAALYERLRPTARQFERASLMPQKELAELACAKIVVIGMGTVGSSVYDQLTPEHRQVLVGIDGAPDLVAGHKAAGRNVVLADVTDDELWEQSAKAPFDVGIVALSSHQENLCIVKSVVESHPKARVFAVARHADEVAELIDAGAHAAWNLYAEVGVGLASEVMAHCRNANPPQGEFVS
ncbi:MAG: cation:proton antiporter, partial [Polyangiales bacterium]